MYQNNLQDTLTAWRVIKNFNKQHCKQWWGLHFIPFLTPVFGSLETTRAGHLSSLIDEFDGERDTLLLPEELIDSVTDLVSVGERGKPSLQAVAMFYVRY